jgi:GT2 family glycosyltransferase
VTAPAVTLSEPQQSLWTWWLDRLGPHTRFDGAGGPAESPGTEETFEIERFRARFVLPWPEASVATEARRQARRKRRSTVRVVIITHNEGQRLVDTVAAYQRTLPPGGEIVVVDDQSTDGSPGIVAANHRDVAVLTAPRRLGISAARNLGARASNADIIVWSDAHCEPEEGWCEPLLEALDDPVVGAVAPAINALEKDNLPWGGGFLWRDASMAMRWLPVRSESHYSVPFMCGCVIATRPDVFAKTGGFDEGLVVWGMEDSELSLRLWLMGYEVHVAGSSRVRHLFRPRFPYPFELSWMYHNILRVATVHFGPDRLRRALGHYMRGGGSACVEGMAALLTSDAARRRQLIDQVRKRDDEWFFRRFDTDVFPTYHPGAQSHGDQPEQAGSRDAPPGADDASLEPVDANA